jgi:putative membrane protein
MSNQDLIKAAHVWALAVLLACGLLALAVKAGTGIQEQQNQNSNQNQNRNSNANTAGNANKTQNDNANGGTNRNTGDQTGMGALSSRDREFVMDAAMSGMMEVELGRIASQRGSTDGVKQFGQRMVDDHSKANTELATIVSSKGITVPTALDEKHQTHVTKLGGMSGAEFDRAYMKMMVNEHERDVDKFEKESTRGTDADLKAFATKTLPTLQEHLQMAKTLIGAQGGKSNSNRNSNGNSNRP